MFIDKFITKQKDKELVDYLYNSFLLDFPDINNSSDKLILERVIFDIIKLMRMEESLLAGKNISEVNITAIQTRIENSLSKLGMLREKRKGSSGSNIANLFEKYDSGKIKEMEDVFRKEEMEREKVAIDIDEFNLYD